VLDSGAGLMISKLHSLPEISWSAFLSVAYWNFYEFPVYIVYTIFLDSDTDAVNDMEGFDA